MLLSRFWYVVLAAVAGISMAAASLVRSTYERDRAHDSELLLRGDRRQIEEFLRTDARVRLDNMIPMAANPDLTRAVDAANRRTNEAALRDLATRVSTQLNTLNNQERPEARADMLLAIDARGYVVGRAGDSGNSGIGDYLGGVPLIARALDGYVRDDTWELTGRVFRMAARPVIYQGRYVGAVVSATEINNAFVRRISEALGGATVVFFTPTGWRAEQPGEADRRGRPAPTPAMIASGINALAQNQQWRERGYTDPIHMQNGEASAIYGALVGTVGVNGGGFAVGRPQPVLPADYLLHAPSDEVKRVRWPVIIALMVGGAALGLLFIYLEHDRNDRQLREMLNRLAERKIDRLDPLALRGNARKTALAINEAFERAMKEELARAGAKPRRSVEDLDALLGPTPGSSPSQPMIDIPPPPPPPPGGGSGLIPGPPPPRMAPPPPMGGPMPPPPGGASRPNITAVGAPPPPPPSGSRPNIPTPGPQPVGVPAPPPPTAPTPAATAAAAPAPNAFADVDDEPTNVAQMPPGTVPSAPRPAAGVPASVAAAGGATATATGPLVGGATDADEQAHWREVFDQFVATKKQCGEPTDTLVFEKFAATLVRHKEQLVQRTKCRAVRFQVYVKDGKATLKATPVK